MLTSPARMQIMRERLEMAFAPATLEIIDDSEKHIGHAGSRDGAGHFTVKITAESLATKNRVEAHRAIYAALSDLIPHEIHALIINVLK